MRIAIGLPICYTSNMVCPHCGTANDGRRRVCGRCKARLPSRGNGDTAAVKPSRELTPISSRQVMPDNIIDGRFKILKVLERGGMGEIFLAEDNTSKGKVAIKCIGGAWLADRDAAARFRREAEAVSRLDHPNVCTIYEVARENDREYIVMEYVDGVTLDRLQRLKPLSLARIVDIALQAIEGLIAAQAKHIVHLDIKPGNIMIDKGGRVKILDFGIAEFRPRQTADRKARRIEPGQSAPGFVMGSVPYMSPEQLEGLDLDGRSDIFSFGVVLYELLTGENPFSDPDPVVTLYNIQHRGIPSDNKIPKDLQQIVAKALRKDRRQRYGNFEEIKADLSAVKKTVGRQPAAT